MADNMAASPEANGGGGPEQLMKMVAGIQKALGMLAQGLEGSAPPEAMKALSMAVDSFNEFVTVISGGQGQNAPTPAPGGAEQSAGNANAQPVR